MKKVIKFFKSPSMVLLTMGVLFFLYMVIGAVIVGDENNSKNIITMEKK